MYQLADPSNLKRSPKRSPLGQGKNPTNILLSSIRAIVHPIVRQKQVLTKDCSSNIWVRDPEHSNPLEIVKDIQGKIYVRAQVHHFSCWSLFQKQTPVDLGNQKFKQERIPRMQQKRHQSVIKNDRDGGVTIHVYAMRMSQWSAALESADVEASVASVAGGHVRLGGGVRRQDAAAASMPQMVTIEPGGSHWLEIPRIGTGLWSSRKAVVAIVTAEEPVHDDGRGGNEKMRYVCVFALASSIPFSLFISLAHSSLSICQNPATASSCMEIVSTQSPFVVLQSLISSSALPLSVRCV